MRRDAGSTSSGIGFGGTAGVMGLSVNTMSDTERITPLQMSALVGHFRATKIKVPEHNYPKKLFLQTIRSSADIRFFRTLAVEKGCLARDQAEQVTRKDELFDRVLNKVPQGFL